MQNPFMKKKGKAGFSNLNHNLKRIIFEFLPFEENFNSLFSCNKAFINILKKFKMFNLIRNGAIKKILNDEDFIAQFLIKSLETHEENFENMEEMRSFLIRMLNKTYMGKEEFCFNRFSDFPHLKYFAILKEFLIRNKTIKKIIFDRSDYEDECFFVVMESLKEIISKNNQIDSIALKYFCASDYLSEGSVTNDIPKHLKILIEFITHLPASINKLDISNNGLNKLRMECCF